jgi:hypothetical protein
VLGGVERDSASVQGDLLTWGSSSRGLWREGQWLTWDSSSRELWHGGEWLIWDSSSRDRAPKGSGSPGTPVLENRGKKGRRSSGTPVPESNGTVLGSQSPPRKRKPRRKYSTTTYDYWTPEEDEVLSEIVTSGDLDTEVPKLLPGRTPKQAEHAGGTWKSVAPQPR